MSDQFLAKFSVTGLSDLMFGKPVVSQKKDNETHEQFERRTWQEKLFVTKEGQLFLNPFSLTNSLVSAAAWLKRKVPGEKGATYTKRFQRAVTPHENILLYSNESKPKPLTIDAVDPVLLFVPSDGKHGSSKRVNRIFPTLHAWKAIGNCLVFDGKITEEQFRDHLVAVGRYIGWGSMRVEGGGINGRFFVDEVTFEEVA